MLLNKIFSSHMVFAANKPILIYGEGKGVGEITFAGVTKKVVSTERTWEIAFPAMPHGGPYELKCVFENGVTVYEDIYVGDVYLIAGQSNVQFKMRSSSTMPESLLEDNGMLRLFSPERIEKTEKFFPEDGWLPCTKERALDWTAVGYLMGNYITKKKGVAVGLIACYQGASVIESWLPKGALQKAGIALSWGQKHRDHYFPIYEKWCYDGQLYDFVFSQVKPYPVTGVVWYQGESDTTYDEARVYDREVAALITAWREDLRDESLPFIVVQLADFGVNGNSEEWTLLQQAQLRVPTLVDNVAVVQCADVCEKDDIHPPTKDKLAIRIADAFLKKI